MSILVTGGAGYVGSHTVRQLGEVGEHVVVIDDLRGGYAEDVLCGELIQASLEDNSILKYIFEKWNITAVLHFAASSVVEESFKDPIQYYLNNTSNTVRLLHYCKHYHVNQFIFSSTASIYGNPNQVPIPEDVPLQPINPYGSSKQAVELALADFDNSNDNFCYISLRYFNAAGADPHARIGERHNPETHLIPLALQVASGRCDTFYLYGSDYDTPDGTCIRDYIHVEDLAAAHLSALNYLRSYNQSQVFNCGYGYGYSVREVLNSIERVTKQKLNIIKTHRRPGDPPKLVADNSKILHETNWAPRYNELDRIITDAWRWEKQLASL